MANHWIWAIIAVIAFVLEVSTLTLYLLIIGVAATITALVSGLFPDISLVYGALLCVVLTTLGWLALYRWHKPLQRGQGKSMEPGGPVVAEYPSDANGKLRVRYRGTEWDALLPVGSKAEAGDTLYIVEQQGNLLKLSTDNPS